MKRSIVLSLILAICCLLPFTASAEEWSDFFALNEETAIGYDEALSHRVYAGSDFLLMPSSFEPCGLSQMIAMRYGTLPVVRETGGLKDSVKPYNRYTGEGTGFSFADFNAHEMKDAVLLALECYHKPEIMQSLIRQAMEADFSFDRSSEEYAKLYLWML